MRRWALFLVAACTPKETAPVMTVAPIAPPQSVVAVADAGPPPAPAREIACSWSTASMELERVTKICVQPDVDCYGTVSTNVGGKLSMMAPRGALTHFSTALELGAARFRGHVKADDVKVGPARPTAIDGWIVPITLGSLRIEQTEAGKVRVALRDADDFEALQPVAASWPCDGVAFAAMPDAPDVMEPLVPKSKRTKTSRLLSGDVPLSLAPGGAPVATFKANGASVEIVETRGAATRILAQASHAAFVAWVPTSAFANVGTGVGYGTGSGYSGRHYSGGTRCAKDIPLYARIGQKLARAGEIVANHAFDINDVDGKKVVDARQRSVSLLENVTLEVMPEDLEACVK